MAIAGLVILVLGLVAIAYQGIPYTTRETVIEIGSLKATADRDKTFAVPPILAMAAVGGGVALLVLGMRKRAA